MFIEKHRESFGVEPICRVLEFAPSTYYARRSRPPSARAESDAVLDEKIEQIWARSDQTYGAPRVHAQLARDGVYVGRKRVERRMRAHGWQGAYLRRGWRTTTRRDASETAGVPDRVNRVFRAERPNQLWLADITYVRTWQGFFYLLVTWNHAGTHCSCLGVTTS